jgi:hypothetical protein
MTELEQYLAMLHRAGIKLEARAPEDKPGTVVKVYGGYYGFFCEHEFDLSGKLVRVESFE